MKTNKTAEAHAMILSIVEESYNQLAQAAAEGFAGNVDSLGEAFRDFSETLGKTLEPALIAVTKSLTALLKAVNDFINSPIAVTATIFTGIALAAKGVSVALPLISAGLMKVAAAGGVATIALNAIPFVAIATAAGIFTTAIVKASQKQRDFNKALREGDEQALKSEFNRLFIKRQKLLQRISEAQESSNKRVLQSLKDQLQTVNEQIGPIKEKLDENRKIDQEIGNQNKKLEDQEDLINKNAEATKKLKEKMTAVGQEIESSIKSNLRDAVTGAQSFGDAMNNVLNKIKNKLLDKAFDKLFEGFEKGFSGEKQEKGGLGGFLGGVIGGLFRANGGPVKAGQPYIVGERQPELFVPNRSGTIIPSVTSGGDSITNIINVSVDASGSSVQGDTGASQQLGETIALVVQETIVREKRNGGLLA